MQDMIIELSKVEWGVNRLDDGYQMKGQKGFDGSEGPEFVRVSFPGRAIPPHYHKGSQFQLLLDGTLEFTDSRMDGVAVHYTDHNVPYGPFKTGPGHDMIVVHALPAGVQDMLDVRHDKALQGEVNTAGRELRCSAHEVEWEPLPGCEGARRKVLIAKSAGPSAEIIECQPGVVLPEEPAPFGRYELILKGSALVNGSETAAPAMRFVRGDERPSPLVAGPKGATFITMTFDHDAAVSYGGSMADYVPPHLYGRTLKTRADAPA